MTKNFLNFLKNTNLYTQESQQTANRVTQIDHTQACDSKNAESQRLREKSLNQQEKKMNHHI